ncbi:hypothetical protein PVAND_014738 [Polypedilum vanderplanki]|uniref:Uncharacterized protein n=1 Tax=Polypedilum vanderplanki TaxID=319348 RepID=A0A9J6BAU8_POLVA|nr:hypothetical protein PVAND_014738 [Polypedilum vanderplanki]
MNLLKFFIIFSLFNFSEVARIKEPWKPKSTSAKWKAIKCQADNKTIVLRYCYLKAYSRYVSTANIGITLKTPIVKPFYCQMIVNYRYGTIYRQYIDTKQRELCSFLSGVDGHPLMTTSLASVFDSVFDMIHECPYSGDLDFRNITYNDMGGHMESENMLIPRGTYRFDNIFYKNGKRVFYHNLTIEFTQPKDL